MARRTIRSGPKPRYAWVPAQDLNNAIADGSITSSIDLLGNYLGDTNRDVGPGMVIERIIGSLGVVSQTVGVGASFIMGLLLVPEGGLASTPNPGTEINDYLLWISGFVPQTAHETGPAGTFTPERALYQFDVRVRRRIRSVGDEVRGFYSNPSEGIIPLVSWNTRILLRVT